MGIQKGDWVTINIKRTIKRLVFFINQTKFFELET